MSKKKPAPISKALVPAPRPVTLEVLDAMPAAPSPHHVSLGEMNVEQLTGMVQGLDRTREQCESMSGICATLAGLVLLEIKGRLDHGQWKPWLKEHFPKSDETARKYMRLGDEFRKNQPRLAFNQMTLALMDGAQDLSGQSLDMTHPVVSAVSKWAKGRSFYQLREDELAAGGKGGKTYDREDGKGTRTPPTPEEATELLKSICSNTGQHLAAVHGEHAYVVLNDAEIDGLVDHCETVLKDLQAWRRLSKTERSAVLAAQLTRQLAMQ